MNSSPAGLVQVVITNPPPGRSLVGLALEESAEGGTTVQYVLQYWHRDVGSTANFSAAREVTFL